MRRFLLSGSFLLLIPTVTAAQAIPESLLPPGSQFYLRCDGLDAHRADFDKTAIGQTMQGDTGTFLAELVHFLVKQLDALGDQVDPRALAIIKHLPQAVGAIGKNGFRLGVEIHRLHPLEIEAMLVVPGAGAADGPVFELLQKLSAFGTLEKGKKLSGERVHFSLAFAKTVISWWDRSEDAVIVITPDRAKRARESGLTAHPLYQQLKSFRAFSTWADGFVDVARIAKLAGDGNPDVKRLIDVLGLNGVNSITFHSGPDGPAIRTVLQLDMPGPRTGLTRILASRKLSLTDLPPLPKDVISFSAFHMDIPALYDTVLRGAEAAVRIVNPDHEDAVKQAVALVETVLGVRIRQDLVGSIDGLLTIYNSPADGPFGFGTVYMIKLKDADKVRRALDKLSRGASALPFLDLAVKKTYRGVPINELIFRRDASPQLPAYAIHKGWLVYSSYPQPIRGYILRANGDLPAWKPSADLTNRLAAFPRNVIGIAVSDPRPVLKLLFSLGPTAAGMINNLTARLGPQARFDLSLVPNAHAVTRYLFPNVMVITDDGRRLRIESRMSVVLPF